LRERVGVRAGRSDASNRIAGVFRKIALTLALSRKRERGHCAKWRKV
jgi:hypothetical protein